MVLNIGERIKGFLFTPSETFDDSRDDTLGDAFKYFVVIVMIIPVIIMAIIAVFIAMMPRAMFSWPGGPRFGIY